MKTREYILDLFMRKEEFFDVATMLQPLRNATLDALQKLEETFALIIQRRLVGNGPRESCVAVGTMGDRQAYELAEAMLCHAALDSDFIERGFLVHRPPLFCAHCSDYVG